MTDERAGRATTGLWPAAAREDRAGWLLRELIVVGVAALAAAGSLAIAAANRSEGMEVSAVSVALLVLAVAALPFRHRHPVGVLVVAFVTTLVYVSFYAQGPVWVPLVVAFGQVVLTGHRRVAVASLLAGFVLFLWLGVVLGDESAPSAAQVVGLAAWLLFLLALTEVIRARQERARAQARTQAEALRRRATEERLRIARELHDVVAHNMSLISIQAGVALHLMDQRPEQARESLATIKQASKEALVELRSILGVLRHVDEDDVGGGGARGIVEGGAEDPGGWEEGATGGRAAGAPGAGPGRRGAHAAAPRAPVPGLERLDDLVEGSRASGVDVRVERDADLGALPRDVDLAAYRIVQESLTNVARHSDDKSAQVRIHLESGVLAVDVLDEGSGAGRPAAGGVPSGGHGIAGMRERAASVGGSLEAGPRPGRGFAVRARLPVRGVARAGDDETDEEAETA